MQRLHGWRGIPRRAVATPALSLLCFGCIPEQTTPRIATHILFIRQPPTSADALDSLGTLRVAFLDDENTIVTSTRQVVEITLSGTDTAVHLLGHTRESAASGVATFTNLSVDKAGTDYRLVARASGFDSTMSAVFRIAPRVAGGLRFGRDVSGTIAGRKLDSVTVFVVDRAGNVDATSDVAITIRARSDSISGVTTRNAENGVAVFTDLALYKAARDQVLVATGSLLRPDTSNVFAVQMASVTELRFYDLPIASTPVFGVEGGAPYQAAAGTMFTVQVSLADQFGNRVPPECNLICFSQLGPVVPATIMLGENPPGATMTTVNSQTRLPEHGYDWTWGVIIDKPGVGYTLVVTAPPYKSVTSVPFAVLPPRS